MIQRALAGFAVLGAAVGKIYFLETFDEGWEKRWVHSEFNAPEGAQGTFNLSTGKWFRDAKVDKGLFTMQDMRYYGITASFEPFTNEDKDFILQYQVKHEKEYNCGGSYIKVGPPLDDPKEFGHHTNYNIMFGPDKCAYQARTHLIFEHDGLNHRKKEDIPFHKDQERTHCSCLYTLVLHPDNELRVEINGKTVYEGNMKEDWNLFGRRIVRDAGAKKPKDWVDEAHIPRVGATKPADWVDEKRIRDKTAQPPPDWDEEVDGKFVPPKIDNPEYKGPWTPPLMHNPQYKGAWLAPRVTNPEYQEVEDVYLYEFGYVGFDLWQTVGATQFDNILITDNYEDAEYYQKEWSALARLEHESQDDEDDEERENRAKKKYLERQQKLADQRARKAAEAKLAAKKAAAKGETTSKSPDQGAEDGNEGEEKYERDEV